MKHIIYALMLVLCLSIVGCQKEPEPIKVSAVVLNSTSLSLLEGETATLSATVTPSNAVNKTVHWSTSNSNVATVSNGIVTAVKSGTATITATSDDGGKTAECAVTVKGGKATVKKMTILYHGAAYEGLKDTFTFFYLTDGRISKVVATGEWENYEYSYEYSPGTLSIVQQYPDKSLRNYTYYLGANGYIVSGIHGWGIESFYYDGTYLQMFVEDYRNIEHYATYKYTWNDGNIVAKDYTTNWITSTTLFHYSTFDNPFVNCAVDVVRAFAENGPGGLGEANLLGESCCHLPDIVETYQDGVKISQSSFEYSFNDEGQLVKIIEYDNAEKYITIILEY